MFEVNGTTYFAPPILKEFNQHKCYRCLYSDNEYRKSLIKDLKDKLLAAAGEKILKEVEKKKQEYIEELEEEVPDELKGVIKKPEELLKKGLGDLLGGKKDDE